MGSRFCSLLLSLARLFVGYPASLLADALDTVRFRHHTLFDLLVRVPVRQAAAHLAPRDHPRFDDGKANSLLEKERVLSRKQKPAPEHNPVKTLEYTKPECVFTAIPAQNSAATSCNLAVSGAQRASNISKAILKVIKEE